MPGNHGEISLNEQNGVDNDNKKTRTTRKKKKKKNDVIIIGDDDNENSSHQLVMPSITKTRNRFVAKIIRKKPKSPKRCSSPPPSSSSRSGSRKGSCFRMLRPRRTEDLYDSCASSPTSDPNDESFTHEMLKAMLETNDFFSNECNPHR